MTERDASGRRRALRAVTGLLLLGAALSCARIVNPPPNLEFEQLAGLNLTGRRWAHARLVSAELSGADLTGADLRGADLSSACLRGALLRKADLRGANLSFACLDTADLQGARLEGALLDGARFSATTHWPAAFRPAEHAARHHTHGPRPFYRFAAHSSGRQAGMIARLPQPANQRGAAGENPPGPAPSFLAAMLETLQHAIAE